MWRWCLCVFITVCLESVGVMIYSSGLMLVVKNQEVRLFSFCVLDTLSDILFITRFLFKMGLC